MKMFPRLKPSRVSLVPVTLRVHCACVHSVTYRCWPSPGAVAGTTPVSRRGPGSLGRSAHSPARWCCGHTHIAALHHVTHIQMRAGCTYTCREHKQNLPWLKKLCVEPSDGARRYFLSLSPFTSSLPDETNLWCTSLDANCY